MKEDKEKVFCLDVLSIVTKHSFLSYHSLYDVFLLLSLDDCLNQMSVFRGFLENSSLVELFLPLL